MYILCVSLREAVHCVYTHLPRIESWWKISQDRREIFFDSLIQVVTFIQDQDCSSRYTILTHVVLAHVYTCVKRANLTYSLNWYNEKSRKKRLILSKGIHREHNDDNRRWQRHRRREELFFFFPAGFVLRWLSRVNRLRSAFSTFTRWVLSRTRRWLLFLSLILSRAHLFYPANLFQRTFNSTRYIGPEWFSPSLWNRLYQTI